MVRLSNQSVLLVGDLQHEVRTALAHTFPTAQITSVDNVFDGIAELSSRTFTAVLAAAEPIERRPEPAVRVLRELTRAGRLILFGHPTLEILSRKMMQFGCDDYLILPAAAAELHQALGSGAMHVTPPTAQPRPGNGKVAQPPAALRTLAELPLAEIFLEALLHSPQNAPAAAVRAINDRIAPALELRYLSRSARPVDPIHGHAILTQPLHIAGGEAGALALICPASADAKQHSHVLTQVANLMSKVVALQDRHHRLQRLAITDDLTGLYNGRYFNHFLSRILVRAREERFPVTLLLFDIDDFKKYNDQHGHGMGDEILRQTAALMRRCCREHDLVARIGGDEFAVVFWDKEGPRQPLDPKKPVGASRPPQTPVQMFERFRRLAASSDFTGLGASGRGKLSVSGGLAVYPYDAQDAAGLIKAADDYLMFKAKKAGKNSVYLVEERETPPPAR